MPAHINGNKTAAEKMQPANRSLRSREMNEVISIKPGFIINWGMYIMLVIFCIVVFLTTFMKFPETVNIDVNISNASAINNTGEYLASGTTLLKSGKTIQAGQKVFLQLPGNNTFEGSVESVSVSADSSYKVFISIPYQFFSNYSKQSEEGRSISAKAGIRVGEHTLFDRLFANLLPSLKNKETTL